ncbi:DUF6383 domain-containing protein [Parabacteroides sp. TM07-1AC]|jgi:hypothetical protein|uniref:DUF6383 domain-containing protein n=1 Tax=Parabacteroides sp. TM07-1AC TaxID=2292363 RepID=UPI0018F3C650|nr:DUF6383 domain-containing protein [Parabacteroides sp. TM07-1AC]
MNKKLSLMMAAFLAAGYSVTAEAGIIKVTGAVTAGYKYIVTTDGTKTLSAAEGTLSTVTTTTATGEFGNAMLWQVVDEESGAFKLANVGLAEDNQLTQADATVGLGASGVEFVTLGTTSDLLKTADGSLPDLKLADGPAFVSTGSADAYLYIATTPAYSKTADGSFVYVTIDGKYAVNTTGTTVIYLDGTTIAMLGLQDKAQFTVNAEGQIMKGSNGISQIAASAITLAGSSIPSIDKDANNAANKVLYLTADDGTATAATDASKFALITTAPSVAPQVPAGALAWTNGTTGVLYVTPAGDATTVNAVKADGTGAEAAATTNTALTIKLNSSGTYSLFDGDAQVALKDEASFSIVKVGNGFIAKAADGKVLSITGTTLSWEATDGSLSAEKSVAVLSFSKGTLQDITAENLAKIENGGITLAASYDNGKTDIKGNPFTGFLTVVDLGGNNFNLKSGNKFIIGRKDMIEGAATVAWGFTTVDKLSDMKDGDLAVFTAQTYAGEVNPSEVVLTLTSAGTVGYYKVPDAVYMGAGATPKTVTFSLGTGTLAKWQDVLQKGKFFTVEKIKDYSTDNAKAEGYLVATGKTTTDHAYNKTVRNVLEGEWALTLNADKSKYVLTNRETPEVTFEFVGVNALYTTTSPYTYVSGADKYIITPVAAHAATDGYKTLDQLEMSRFNIGSYAGVYDNTAWFTENHGEDKDAGYHVIGLNIDQEEGLIYEAIAHNQKRDKDHAVTDSIYVVSTIGYYDATISNYAEVLDTLKVVSYTFKNQYNEPLYVKAADADFSKITYVSSANANAADPTKATQFTLRLDTDNTLNLRPVVLDATTGYNTFDVTKDFNKAYAGSSLNKGLVSSTDLYEREENDRFVVAPLAYEMYRRLDNVKDATLDTISIFREGNNKEVLFENGQFLGMNNQVQFPAIAPAMVVDSAYAPAETYRPQYMLMVEPNYVPAGTWCPEHGFNPGCSHAQPIKAYTEGRYLVNLKDTARAWVDANKHGGINPYTNSEGYVKLAFVPAKHIGDTLIIKSDNKKLTVNTTAFNEAKFAFRYVDAEAKSFVIETADYNLADGKIKTTPGYLKWMNGVIVVVDNIKNADVYNMNEDEKGNPTANEGINASEVSVIAKEGEVVINGAAGKKVTISNVLGQTIANTVLSSDNATIAAPQGVVVVAVEGEAAVKAIVK